MLNKSCLSVRYSAEVTLHSKTLFCTRCPYFMQLFATKRRRLLPADVSGILWMILLELWNIVHLWIRLFSGFPVCMLHPFLFPSSFVPLPFMNFLLLFSWFFFIIFSIAILWNIVHLFMKADILPILFSCYRKSIHKSIAINIRSFEMGKSSSHIYYFQRRIYYE